MASIKKLPVFLLPLILCFVIGAVLVSAQGTNTNPPPTGSNSNPGVNISLTNPFQNSGTLFALMKNITNNLLLPIGGILAVLAFIYSGFLYVTAQGKEAQISKAHKALLYTAIGTAVLLGATALANLVCTTITQLGGPACT